MDGSQPAPITSISSASPFASSPAPPKQPFPQSMNLSFESQTPGSHEPGPYFHQNSALTPYNPLNNNNESGGGGNNSNNKGEFGGGEGMKKKRGRPRKYGPDGAMGLGLKSGGSGSGVPGGSAANAAFKKMGRPPGSSKKKQLEALGASGVAFTPHIITVPPGEDVASKIMAFSQQGPRTICILSANGAISNVSLRQAATSGGLVTYEGRFEIISLSGSFLLAQDGDTKSRTGGLSVALSGSDGRVLGGCVAGMLLAATPVQVVVGSFIAEGKKPKQNPDPIISPHSHSHSHSQPIPAPPLTSPHLPSPQPIRPGPPPHFGAPGPHNMNNNNSPFGAPPPAGNSPGSDVMSDEYSSSNEDEDHDDGPMQHHVAPRFSDPGRASHFNHMGWPISSVDGGNNNNQNRRE